MSNWMRLSRAGQNAVLIIGLRLPTALMGLIGLCGLGWSASAHAIAQADAQATEIQDPQTPKTPQGPLTDPADLLRLHFAALRALMPAQAYEQHGQVAALVEQLRLELDQAEPTRRRQVMSCLLDLVSLGLDPELVLAGADLEADAVNRYRSMGMQALSTYLQTRDSSQEFGAGELDSEASAIPARQQDAEWLARDVLAPLNRYSTPQRTAALMLVRAARPSGIGLALLSIAKRDEDPLQAAAMTALVQFPSAAIDRFLIERLGKTRQSVSADAPDTSDLPHPFTLLQMRIDSGEPLEQAAGELLVERLSFELLSQDWRRGARAIRLSQGLHTDQRVPMLIEGLGVWAKRRERGKGSKRIEFDLLEELRLISKRSFGTKASRWSTWWSRVQSGEIPFRDPNGGESDSDPNETRAQFFGLRPISDRITFVIDRSGSMDSGFGTAGRTRYQEAVEQMLSYLHASGIETRFNAVLFNHELLVSSEHLRPATPDLLEQARRDLLGVSVLGGTHLRPAIEQAVLLGQKNVDLSRLEADTVVVLCDGQTEEGAQWVRSFLEQHNQLSEIRFHCVLLGGRRDDDGTLRQLAETTGGDFIRTGG